VLWILELVLVVTAGVLTVSLFLLTTSQETKMFKGGVGSLIANIFLALIMSCYIGWTIIPQASGHAMAGLAQRLQLTHVNNEQSLSSKSGACFLLPLSFLAAVLLFVL
jgi:hypothetical protein